MKKLMMVMGFLALASVGTGCDGEPEGSCTTSEYGVEHPYSHEVCREDSTASTCAAAGGTFDEGGDCALFTLIHLPAIGAD